MDGIGILDKVRLIEAAVMARFLVFLECLLW